jgi:hypothetical protein
MEENIISVQVMRKFAIFVDGELVSITNCDDRMAAILNSDPRFEEILDD